MIFQTVKFLASMLNPFQMILLIDYLNQRLKQVDFELLRVRNKKD